MAALELDTPRGLARVHLHPTDEPTAAVALGHGAGGGVTAPDLVAATKAALSQGVTVALVEQPYRVAGRRSPPPAHHLDTAWTTVIEQLVAGELEGLPVITGGRSAGARVACRTAAATGAIGVMCLAFPLQSPRRSGGKPGESRLPELDAVDVPMLIVQGDRDQFGMPPESPSRTVAQVAGNHALKSDPEAIGAAVEGWLPGVIHT